MIRRWPSFLKSLGLLYTYFKQLFAQVTNPPIDPIREELVMSVEVLAGARLNWLCETPQHARLIRLQSPVLTTPELQQIRDLTDPIYKSVVLSACFSVTDGTRWSQEAVGSPLSGSSNGCSGWRTRLDFERFRQ